MTSQSLTAEIAMIREDARQKREKSEQLAREAERIRDQAVQAEAETQQLREEHQRNLQAAEYYRNQTYACNQGSSKSI